MSLFNIGSKLHNLFSKNTLDESFYENLEDMLIEGDFGSKNAMMISDEVRDKKPKTEDDFLSIVSSMLSDKINSVELNPPEDDVSLYLILGVNGVGKTTSIAKMAKYYTEKGHNVLLAAGDTFRAAAVDQLDIHADKLGVRIVKQNTGSDPGAVIFDAISSALSKKENLILCDTAGRMHNKENLIKELQKIDKIVCSRIKKENYKKILVIDATTGQNAVSQAQIFNDAVGLDAIIITKYDSTSKAGAVAQIPVPVAFVGTGESYDDFKVFDKDDFIRSLMGI